MPEILYIIPAREGSKGFPHKNRKLIKHTLNALEGLWTDVYITTDDEAIKKKYKDTPLEIIDRPPEFAQDDTSMKDVLLHAVSEIKPCGSTLLVCLYPTYPQRTSQDINNAIEFFITHNANSMLCQKEYNGTSPYLLMFPQENYRGEQVIPHNLYRRQDYSPVFEISHFIIIMKVSELSKLNDNLYTYNTLFMPIGNTIDVDTKTDYKSFLKK